MIQTMLSLKIGESVPCVCCGESNISREDRFLCQDCIAMQDADEDFYLTCGCCGSKIYDDDEVIFVNDAPYCMTCHHYSDIISEENEEEE